jgi:23S rRNA (adenine2503-C2)-methyltransferase
MTVTERADGLELLRAVRRGREALASELGVQPYRVTQLLQWVFGRSVGQYDAMTDLPLSLRARLAERLGPIGPPILDERASSDSTKYLVRLGDGESVECVAMRHPWGGSACLSTQVGCAVGCVFCASGAAGVVRNLSAEEIAGQLLAIRLRHEGIGHVVLMGMGEPLLNPEGTIEALRILSDPALFAVPERNLTVSTVGVVRGIERLAASGLRVRLAVSLHSADPRIRSRLIPRQPDDLRDVVAQARDYEAKVRRRVTYECVLLSGVNDRETDAEALTRLLGVGAHVNLIPLNAVAECAGERPSDAAVRLFEKVLRGLGMKVSVRRSRGAEAEAACGQLRLRLERKQGDWET